MKKEKAQVEKEVEETFKDKNEVEWILHIITFKNVALISLISGNLVNKFDVKISSAYKFFLNYFNAFLYSEVEKYIQNFNEMDKDFEITIVDNYITINIQAEKREDLITG